MGPSSLPKAMSGCPMSMQVWLGAATLTYPQAGGHFWVYLNWALGLRALGCEVVWLESCEPNLPAELRENFLATLRERLQPYGLAESVALTPVEPGCVDLERTRE